MEELLPALAISQDNLDDYANLAGHYIIFIPFTISGLSLEQVHQ